MKTLSKCSMVVSVLVFLIGCGGGERAERATFVLAVDRPPIEQDSEIEGTLEVQSVSVSRLFAGRELIYRTGRYKFESDPTKLFLIPPSEMITGKLCNWLSESGIFTRVIPSGRMIQSDYIMETHVDAIYGDFTKEPATAVVKLEIFLLKQNEIIFEQVYESEVPLRERKPNSLFVSYEKALTEIFTELEGDLSELAELY